MATAFEILDLARVCYMKRLETLEKEEQEESGKGKEAAEGDSPTLRHVKERLADTHDALSEISLENERYEKTRFGNYPTPGSNMVLAIPMPSKMAEHHSSTSSSFTLKSLRLLLRLTTSYP